MARARDVGVALRLEHCGRVKINRVCAHWINTHDRVIYSACSWVFLFVCFCAFLFFWVFFFPRLCGKEMGFVSFLVGN